MLGLQVLPAICLGYLLNLTSALLLQTKGFTGVRSASQKCWSMATSSSSPSGGRSVDVEVISDFACPWCYVGKARLNNAVEALKRAEPDAKVRVSFTPYMIDPQTRPEGEGYLAYNKRRWGSDGWTTSLRRSSRKDGCTFSKWETWPNTLLAHRLQKFAEAAGKGDQVNSLVFQTIYERGKNASDLETLVAVAAEADLPPAEARAYLSSSEGHDAVLRDDHYSKTERNVSGVPCFVIRKAQGDTAPATNDGGGSGPSETVMNGAVAPETLLNALASACRA
eukprot:jgi/Undpi1/1527/HiC_scaffold_11.g04917.m1